MSKNKSEITLLNVLFCLLVVFIHVSSEQIGQLDKSSVSYALLFFPWRLSAFVMQGFVLLSGVKIFLKYKNISFSYGSFLKNRLLKIYLPYLIWTVVYYLYFCYLHYCSFQWGKLLRFLLIGNIVSPFYFIIVIMQLYILMPLWQWIVEKIPAVLGISASLLLMMVVGQMQFPYAERVFTTYLAYWVIGCYIGENYESFCITIKDMFF